MGQRSRTADQSIAELATASKGIVTRPELLAAGVTAAQVKRRIRTGRFIVEFPGVYRVGHRAPSVEMSYLAAVRAGGEEARLAGEAAGYLFSLIRGAAPPPELIAPTERKIPGVRVRRSRRFDPRDATVYRGIPVTTVQRTLVDLAAVLGERDLARACHEAGVRYGVTPAHVRAALARKPNAKGSTKLRAILEGDVHVTLSRLERRFLEQLRERGLPLPQTNREVGGHRVDCRWPEHRLTVELDSYRYHNSRYAWEQDRRRERAAYARGDDFRRYTWADVFEAPDPMFAELTALLAASNPG